MRMKNSRYFHWFVVAYHRAFGGHQNECSIDKFIIWDYGKDIEVKIYYRKISDNEFVGTYCYKRRYYIVTFYLDTKNRIRIIKTLESIYVSNGII